MPVLVLAIISQGLKSPVTTQAPSNSPAAAGTPTAAGLPTFSLPAGNNTTEVSATSMAATTGPDNPGAIVNPDAQRHIYPNNIAARRHSIRSHSHAYRPADSWSLTN